MLSCSAFYVKEKDLNARGVQRQVYIFRYLYRGSGPDLFLFTPASWFNNIYTFSIACLL